MSAQRNPWIAGLLSLLCCQGLGQLYNGKVLKAALFYLGLPVMVFPAFWVMITLRAQPANVLLPFAVLAALQVLGGADAARDAASLRHVVRPWYGRWYALVLVWAANAFVLTPATFALLRTSLVQPFRVAGRSMEPTMMQGDHVLVDKSAYGLHLPGVAPPVCCQRAPRRGDLTIFLFPPRPDKVLVQRVVGLPGEKVEVRGNAVYVDGRPLAEPYAYLRQVSGARERADWGPETVPPGHLFVLGDSRDISADSRVWGFVPVANVLGKVRVVCFSWTAPPFQFRWRRVGHVLR